ncbi:MAG: hypothetical protein H6743_03765 [Rickettsiaceae bacterium]|nr:hypothetical protein [Rickettsiaceae bacterium]
MAQFTKYGDIDNGIQQRMGNQSPDSSIRRDAIRNSIKTLYSKVDLETGKRVKTFYHILDGTPLNITNLITDLKNPSDLRYKEAGKQVVEFAQIDDDSFVRHIDSDRKIDEYTIAYNEGNRFLKVNTSNSEKKVVINAMSSLTDNGTFAVSGDATNLSLEEVRTLDNPSSLKFNVAQVGGITTSDMTSLDLSSWLGLGRIKTTVEIPDVTSLTNIKLKLGSSSANYYEFTVTTQADGAALVDGFNRILFNWETATTTGTPDITAINYLDIIFTHSSAVNLTGFHVEKLTLILPRLLELVYFTHYTGFTEEGALIDEIDGDNTEDMFLIPAQYEDWLVLKSVEYLAPYAWGSDAANELNLIRKDITEQEGILKIHSGKRQKKEVNKIKIRPTRRIGRSY